MNQDECYYLGYVTKTYGFKGEVMIYLDADNPHYYCKLESVFIQIEGKLIPFFIQQIKLRPNKAEAAVRFQDIDTPEKAQRLIGCDLYLPLELLPPLKGNAFYFHEIAGFEAIDRIKGHIGIISSVLEFPGNPVFQILSGTKEVLIPAHDKFIEKLDRPNKKIYLKAPDGLIDLYLNEQ